MQSEQTLDLLEIKTIAEDIAMQAAERLMEHFGGHLDQLTKATVFDVVTQADQEAEAVIVSELTRHFPQHHIVGEEGGGMGAPIESAEYRWYVDPLDGTSNFANAIPVFSVSIALTDHTMQPLIGVVYDPTRKEMFAAIAGNGTTLNDEPVRVSVATALESGIFASGFPYDKATNPDNNLKQWSAFVTRTRGMRRMGSAALDLCYVAAGRFDGYWEINLNPWDCLAGGLCVREAGGIVSDYAGNESPEIFSGKRIVASNGKLHPLMLSLLNNPS